jgi:lipopolysaccharide export system protein LptC
MRDTQKAVRTSGLYTHVVSHLRWILPLSVVAVLAALVVWPMMGARQLEQIEEKSAPNLVIENLRLSGMDAKNEPYKLMAEKALQIPETKGLFDLDRPKGELATSGGAWIAGQALHGRFDQNSKKLWLGGEVELFHDNGTQFQTSEAQVDLNKNAAWGERPVVIHGSFGEIHGQGFKMFNGGKVLVVTGQSKAVLHMRPSSSTPNPDEEP